MSGDAVLAFDDVHLSFPGPKGRIPVLRGVSFEIAAGELLGLVGESGSGKSFTCFAALGLSDAGGRITEGRILYRGEDLLAASSARRRALRGDRLAMVFQDPMSALNPFLSIATQVSEGLRAHRGHSQRAALARARELLVSCEIRDPDRVMAARPHELSGGMRQRVLLASALALEPDLLFCDEPTTALDVTTQASVLSLIDELRRRVGCSVLFVSHDLGVVSNLADRVAVMYA
ncbi:MAG: ABC transporter ATP-binding protein, partial [Planctomycetes bacterium]|nr:ABC transporter ATP-binding protein [Planctomycetota bacterium]